jgi:hypothetical protein
MLMRHLNLRLLRRFFFLVFQLRLLMQLGFSYISTCPLSQEEEDDDEDDNNNNEKFSQSLY